VKIVVVCILAAVLYGIIHDQITAHICVEYFSVFHPPVFPTQSPTLLGLGWGVIATWWAGAFLGVLLAVAARGGRRAKLSVSALLKPIAMLLIVMALSACMLGTLGYVLAYKEVISPPIDVVSTIPRARYARFMADWWAHSASYVVGFIGGIVVCVTQFRKRVAGAR
jgi:hypothetical protein